MKLQKSNNNNNKTEKKIKQLSSQKKNI